MKVAFTICSNNYLAHAKVLGESFLSHHPEFTFCIGLVDRLSGEIPDNFLDAFTIIPVEDLELQELPELNARYNITELNTAVKPALFHHIFKTFGAQKVIYLDPDILVVSRLSEVIDLLDSNNIIITPHILSPIDDDFIPTDYHTLRGGVFNLGFIALSNYQSVKPFLDWWHVRVLKYGHADFAKSMFYDQLWANYIPCFENMYHILKHPGYNMANWNLHERYLMEDIEHKYLVNKSFPLRFFHFSSYKHDKPQTICSYLTRYSFESRPDLIPLFNEYASLLTGNDVETISRLPVFFYPDLYKRQHKPALIARVVSRIKRATRILLKGS